MATEVAKPVEEPTEPGNGDIGSGREKPPSSPSIAEENREVVRPAGLEPARCYSLEPESARSPVPQVARASRPLFFRAFPLLPLPPSSARTPQPGRRSGKKVARKWQQFAIDYPSGVRTSSPMSSPLVASCSHLHPTAAGSFVQPRDRGGTRSSPAVSYRPHYRCQSITQNRSREMDDSIGTRNSLPLLMNGLVNGADRESLQLGERFSQIFSVRKTTEPTESLGDEP